MSAERAYVLSPADVSRIRAYVQIKYTTMPSERRAEIVADAVARIVARQLPEFPPDLKRELASKLIREAVAERQRPVGADDIYRLCLELDMSEDAVFKPLQAWMRSHRERLTAIPSDQAEVIRLPAVAESAALPNEAKKRWTGQVNGSKRMVYGSLFALLAAVMLIYGIPSNPQNESILSPAAAYLQVPPAAVRTAAVNGLPTELRYHPIDRDKLISYLNGKNSILADKDYMNAIMDAAKQFDIHPLLLFAITGQEQGFVPRTHRQANEIANNPFNVFHSWKEFNTTIAESAEIASRTIVRLSKDKPADMDPIQWINREYAEDPNWHKGVRSIFNALLNHTEASTGK